MCLFGKVKKNNPNRFFQSMKQKTFGLILNKLKAFLKEKVAKKQLCL